MLVETKTTVALRCAGCGRLDVHDLSLFDFSGGRTVQVACTCGAHKFTAGVKGQRFRLQFPCLLCDSTHYLHFPRSEFWSTEVKRITCPDTGLDVGFFGQEQAEGELAPVLLGRQPSGTSAPAQTAEALVEEAGFDEYFDNPQVMYAVLNGLHDLAESGRLSCLCGHREVQVDVLPDRLELTCPVCGRWRRLEAESDGDLAQLGAFEPLAEGERGWQPRESRRPSEAP